MSREALTTSELAIRFWRNRKHVVSASTGDDLVLMVDAISFANECRQARLSPEAIPQNKREESVCNSLDDHTGAFATVDVVEHGTPMSGNSTPKHCNLCQGSEILREEIRAELEAQVSPEAIQQQVKPGHPIAIPTETNPTPSAIERAAWRISLLFAERLHQSKSNTEFLQEILREELGVKI